MMRPRALGQGRNRDSMRTVASAEVRAWQGHEGRLLDTKGGFDVIDCESCRFKHIVPIPSSAELETVYRHEYYSKDKPQYFDRHREDLDWWNLTYRDRYDTFEQLLSAGRRSILDVGSGPGFFLLAGKQRGWKTIGLEPSELALAHSRSLGLEIVEGFLDESVARRLGLFDVVHLSEVLEHVPDPQNVVRIAASLLNPDGLICVLVPNDYNPIQDVLRTLGSSRSTPWWVAPPHHINYFDGGSLSNLLVTAGFAIVSTEATFPIDLFLLMGDNYVGDDVCGRQVHTKRMRMERAFAEAGRGDVKRRLYQAMAAAGIGREILLVGRLRLP